MKPSDVLSGRPLSSDELQELYLTECLAAGRLLDPDAIDGFAEFEVDPARVGRAQATLDHVQSFYETRSP